MQSGHGFTPDCNDLGEQIINEVKSVFRSSSTPHVSDEEVRGSVALLIKLLEHRIDDPDLDAVGGEIQAGLERWFSRHELVKLADRYEPFCKFVLRLVDSVKFAELKRREETPKPGESKPSAAYVLKRSGLGIVSNKECEHFMNASWESFPLAALQGQPNFLEHVGRIYVFRNVDDHRARVLGISEKAEIARSFCVFLVWIVFKFKHGIEAALIKAQFSIHLQNVRNRFAEIGAKYVELLSERRSQDEYRFSGRLSSATDAPPNDEAVPAISLPNDNRVVLIEAEPGAGKTSTLKYLGWLHADRLIKGEDGYRVPLYLELKLLGHCGQTIEAAVAKEIHAAKVTSEIPWDALLLLVDGLNEVATDLQTGFKKEIQSLLARSSKLHVVIAGRPNSFQGEFDAQIVALKRLSTDELERLFRNELGDNAKAASLLGAVLRSAFLSSWVRTPLHAYLVARTARYGDLSSLASHAVVVRRCVREILSRERGQASAEIGRTGPETKEPLLAHLAFETKAASEGVFTRARIRQEFSTAGAKIGANSLAIPAFIEELLDNHLLQRADNEAFEFAHEIYHDYFAAFELESREHSKAGSGTEFALAHFASSEWQECIRLFAGLAHTERVLIERGAERNPFLAWRLLRDAGLDASELVGKVADEAYCALSAQLTTSTKAVLAGACPLVLADLQRHDLLKLAITEQKQTFEPTGLWKLSEADRELATDKQRETVVPLANGLLLLVRLGLWEQRTGHEGRFCLASRVAFQALKQIKAARALTAMLSSWTGTTFDGSKLVPGVVLDTLIDLGVDEVTDREDEKLNRTMVEWLGRASEAGFRKAWPAYARILRCLPDGVEWQPDVALRWARASHDSGDAVGSLELALLLVENPSIENEPGEGERLLRNLTAQGMLEAKYELGKRLMRGNGFLMAEAEGFELLIEAAEAGHVSAWRTELLCLGMNWWVVPELRQLRPNLENKPAVLAPDWSQAFRERWFALMNRQNS